MPLALCVQITLEPGEFGVDGPEEVTLAVLLQNILNTIIQNSLHRESGEWGREGRGREGEGGWMRGVEGE